MEIANSEIQRAAKYRSVSVIICLVQQIVRASADRAGRVVCLAKLGHYALPYAVGQNIVDLPIKHTWDMLEDNSNFGVGSYPILKRL